MWRNKIRSHYPSVDSGEVKEFYFSLDGGGRNIIIDALHRYDVKVMVEIGLFLCGSTTQWLDSKADLTVIGIDPWSANFADTIEKYAVNPVFNSCFSRIADRREFIDSVRTHGSEVSALANVRRFGDRFIPVKDKSPDVLPLLAELGVRPELIYFDSDKVLDDLNICRELFPRAILCGDDWTWGADKGYPVRVSVGQFCQQHNLKVHAERATWMIIDGD